MLLQLNRDCCYNLAAVKKTSNELKYLDMIATVVQQPSYARKKKWVMEGDLNGTRDGWRNAMQSAVKDKRGNGLIGRTGK